MLRTQEFVDDMFDLDREVDDPVQLANEADTLMGRLDAEVVMYIAQRRAAAAADAYYLGGLSKPRIGMQVGHTAQTISNWITTYGPSHYLAISRPRTGRRTQVKAVALGPGAQARQQREKLRELRDDGWRVVPALMNLSAPDDPRLLRGDVDAEQLWRRLDAAA